MSNIRNRPAGDVGNSEKILGHLPQCSSLSELMQDQLADLLFSAEDEEIDLEALDSLLTQMEQAGQFSGRPDAEESLMRFHRRHAAVFDSFHAQSGSEESKPVPPKSSRRFFLRIFAVAAAVFLLFCTAVQAMGGDVFSSLTRFTSEILNLGGRPASYAAVQSHPLAEGERASFDSLEEAVAAFGIEAPIVPKELPERFELVSVVAVNQKSGILIHAKYSSEVGSFQAYYKEIDRYNYHSVEIEKEYTDTTPYVIDRIKHHLSVDNDSQKADWVNGDFECQLFGTVSEEELKDIIHSIY